MYYYYTGRRLFAQSYLDRISSLSPIAYWPLNETSGTTAVCFVNAAQNGTHTGVTLGQAGIGDGNLCPLYDGANDCTNVQTATFASAFSGTAGTLLQWFKLSPGGWSDSTERNIVVVSTDVNNVIDIHKRADAGTWRWFYKAGGTTKTVTISELSFTGWGMHALTWDSAADAMKCYLFWDNGASGGQQGSTQSGLGTWAGSPVGTIIGAYTITPTYVFSGWIAHTAVFDTALGLTTLQNLATV